MTIVLKLFCSFSQSISPIHIQNHYLNVFCPVCALSSAYQTKATVRLTEKCLTYLQLSLVVYMFAISGVIVL